MVGTELVAITTADGVVLDGAAYAPPSPGSTGVLLVHGKGGNFYSGPNRFLGAALATAGHQVLSLNMRYHDIVYITPPPVLHPWGGAYEQFAAGWQDLAAGVAWLRGRGYARIVICGHSSGGLYAVDYATRDRELAGLALLSPLLSNRTPLPRWFPGPGELDAARNRAEAAVATGRPDELIPLGLWYWQISAASLLSRFGEAPDLWDRTFERLKLPILMLYGDQEDRAAQWHAVIAEYAGPGSRVVIAGADHYYTGYEEQVAAAVAAFIGELG